MTKKLIIFVIIIVILVLAYLAFSQKPETNFDQTPKIESTMTITSQVFANNGYIPAKYTCDGENVSPPLAFSNVPAGAKSLVLIVDDPDAPGGTWVHWLVWNINPTDREILEASLPAGSVQGLTSFGKPGYGGPCPPAGSHRYLFKLYALTTKLDLSPAANKTQLEQTIAGYILTTAELVGLYERR